MAYWLGYGFNIFYSDENNCDNIDSTAFLSSIMFVILFIGYFLIVMYLMILFTFPCVYYAVRDTIDTNRIAAGGVGQS